jgi:hypothetical protein
MKLAISIMTAVSLGLACTALADNYGTLAAKGYRWVTVHGPYGIIETPENSGLMPSVDTAIVPTLTDKSTARTGQNGTP